MKKEMSTMDACFKISDGRILQTAIGERLGNARKSRILKEKDMLAQRRSLRK
jgi:hypothetical protein